MQASRRVFLSFASEDLAFVRGVRLLARNPGIDLDFYDESLRVAVNSTQAEYVKRVIRDKISRASVTVCFIGPATHLSPWVDWELEESLRCGNRIVAMAVKGCDSAILPALVKQTGLTFHPWDYAALQRLTNQ